MKANQAEHGVATMCRVLGVSPSGYYAWRRRGWSGRRRGDEELRGAIRTIHRASRGTYGVPRVHAELAAGGVRVSRKRVARLMREAGLAGVSRRRSARTTRVDRSHGAAPDRVERRFRADAPDRIWVADITYVPTWNGFVYLAIVLDVFSRKVVGWAMAHHLRTELVLAALNMALGQRRPQGVVHHSDKGSQGEFNRSSQHFDREGLRWEQTRVESPTARDGLRCRPLAGRRRRDESIGNDSGGRLPRGHRAKMLRGWRACRHQSVADGSVRVVVCSAILLRCPVATCRSPSGKILQSCTHRGLGFVRLHGGLVVVHRRSRANCAETPQPVVGDWSIERQRPSGTPSGVANVRRLPSLPRMTSCADTYKIDSPAPSPLLTEPVSPAHRYGGTAGAVVVGRIDAGPSRGVRSRSRTGSPSTFPRMIRCGSRMRPSTKHSTCKAAVYYGANWSRVCGPGGLFGFRERVPVDAGRSSSHQRS